MKHSRYASKIRPLVIIGAGILLFGLAAAFSLDLKRATADVVQPVIEQAPPASGSDRGSNGIETKEVCRGCDDPNESTPQATGIPFLMKPLLSDGQFVYGPNVGDLT